MPQHTHTLTDLLAKQAANRAEMQALAQELTQVANTHRFLRDGDNIACYHTADFPTAA